MKLLIILIFCFNSYASYQLHPDIQSNELTKVIGHLEKKQLKELTPDINRWAPGLDKINLKLLIKTLFYKEFLNYSSKYLSSPSKPLTKREVDLIQNKIENKAGSTFGQWFIEKMLNEYKSSPRNSLTYLAPWLIQYRNLSKHDWDQLLNRASLTYLKNLSQSMKLLSKFSQLDRTASKLFQSKNLINWHPEPLNRSKAIDEIDKNLPKTQ